MSKRIITSLIVASLFGNFAWAGNHTKYVNPFIGTGAVENSLSGNCYPGATLPFGMVQLSPDTQDAPDWDKASGYDYNDQNIMGFSHTRLSGTGACDLIDILLMPTSQDGTEKPFSPFSHQDEEAHPGFYKVKLGNSGIIAQLSATLRTGIHQYTFPKGNRQRIYLDIDHSAPKGSWNRRIIQSQIHIINPTTIEGWRIITGWAKLRRVYFHIELSKPITSHILIDGGRQEMNATLINGSELKAFFDFDHQDDSPITCKVSLSNTSIENARDNMRTEANSWDFEHYKNEADNTWEQHLGRIEVSGSQKNMLMFYTALYHTMIQPNLHSDANGSYTAPDYSTQHMAKGMNYYTTFSLWDTFRAAHPLYTLIVPEKNKEFVNSMLTHYERYGYLPIWDLYGQDNYCMIGNHAIPVIVDTYLKGQLKGIEAEKIWDAVYTSSTRSHLGSNFEAWEKYGYMPEDVQTQSVSVTLEQAFDDWCVAQLAKKLGKQEAYDRFMKRSSYYRNLFNPANGFFQGKKSDGKWLEPFDPLKYGANGGYPYTEGNAWQYNWYVPQNIPDLIQLMGGKKAFMQRLDKFFTLTDTSGEKNDNASGFIGQYVHGNEPSHHVAYLYDYAGEPHKTQKLVWQIMNTLYNTSSSGYAGNDDCGEMSSWLVFSAMGFYPVCPTGGEYALGTPLFNDVKIHLQNGKVFRITANRKKDTDFYVKNVMMNGKKLKGNFIQQKDIENGGTLTFQL